MNGFEKLDIIELIEQNPVTIFSNAYQGKFIEKIKENFSETQQRLYIASLYTFLNYSKTDFVIDMSDIWKWLGFGRKNDCKKVLEKHFINTQDYIVKLATASPVAVLKKQNGGQNKEKLLMTINTFKNLCLLSQTKKAKEIHQYYIKLEEITQETLMEQLNEQNNIIDEQQYRINELESKPETEGFIRSNGYIYLIEDTTKKGHNKIGFSDSPYKRLGQLNTSSSTFSLRIVKTFETYDKEFAEKLIHFALKPFKIKNRKEWFYAKNDIELAYVIQTIESCIDYIKQYDIKDYNQFKELNKTLKLELIRETDENIQNQKKEKNSKICKTNAQQFTAKTGNYKGVHWNEEKNKWTATLTRDYKKIHLGHYDSEIEAGQAYNDYALYLNNTFEGCNYSLNDIPDYISTPRNIPELTKEQLLNSKLSKNDDEKNIYTGVTYDSKRKIYKASIKFEKKSLYLGCSKDMTECAKLYNQQASYFNKHKGTTYILNDIPDYITIEKNIYIELQNNKKETTSSKYFGVSFSKQKNKWRALYVLNKKQINVGLFNTELDAAKAYNEIVIKLNSDGLSRYKVNIIEE